MFFSLAALIASGAALVSAQASNGTNHQVIVGGPAGLVFTPSTITAAVGDTVTFEFQSKNHTVTQSSFATPCALLTNTTTNQVGFDSDFVPVPANASSFPAWTLQVTGTKPIWFYCKQTGHCAQGMVGAINAPTTGSNTFDAYLALAKSGGTNSTGSTGTTTTGSTGGSSTTGSTGGDSNSSGSTNTPSPAGRTTASIALAGVAAAFALLA